MNLGSPDTKYSTHKSGEMAVFDKCKNKMSPRFPELLNDNPQCFLIMIITSGWRNLESSCHFKYQPVFVMNILILIMLKLPSEVLHFE